VALRAPWLTGAMTRGHDIAPGRPRIGIAFLAAVLLTAVTGAAAFALAAPERASAAPAVSCPEGQVCIWKHAFYKGARYTSGGHEMNLADNVFHNSRSFVASHGSAIYNNGDPGGRDGVLFYMRADDDVALKSVPKFCLRVGTAVRNLATWNARNGRSWNDNIGGYRWVTDATCVKVGVPVR
jgi:Peptidase inhibitor family I36